MTPFQSIATAIAAQVGTGNLAGAATALLGGGPGAIFWMWVSAFFGMSTIYAEATLAQNFKTEINGEVTGGPVYYIKAAFKGTLGKVLAGLFAIFIVLALGFMGNMVQANSIGAAFTEAFGAFNITISPVVIGVIVAAVAAFVFLGGTQRLASVVEKVVPIMAGVYIVGSLILIIMNITNLPAAIKMIFVGAFDPQAVLGAGAGIAYLCGGGFKEVVHTVVNALAIVSGIVCDGAKASCAAKIASAVDAGILGYNMYIRGQQFYGGDGIVTKGVEATLKNVGRLGKEGMKETNEEIIKIMIGE